LKSKLARDIGVSPAAVTHYESGSNRPSPATLAKIAMALGMPADFFTKGRAIYEVREDDAHFRSLRSTRKVERSAARAQIELLAEVVELFEQRLNLPPVDLPTDLADLDPESAAETLRERWNLGLGPLASVVGVLERRGVVVARLRGLTQRVDAFSCWLGSRPYVVLLANKGAADRSRFDAAHELGHLLLHADATPGAKQLEGDAHKFASAFLLPRSAIASELPSRVDFGRLVDLKMRWGVSIQALLRRGLDLAIYSEAAYRNAMTRMSAHGWRHQEPGDIGPPETPQLLSAAYTMVTSRFGSEVLSDHLRLPRHDIEDLLALVTAPKTAGDMVGTAP